MSLMEVDSVDGSCVGIWMEAMGEMMLDQEETRATDEF